MTIATENEKYQRHFCGEITDINHYWERAKELVDKEVMAEARAIFKTETGKTVSNFALERLLRTHTANLLIAMEKANAEGWVNCGKCRSPGSCGLTENCFGGHKDNDG